MAWTGRRPLATSWPPDLRSATATGAAQRFSHTRTAAEVPGSRAAAASWRSSSPRSPVEAPSNSEKPALSPFATAARSMAATVPSSSLTMKAMSRIRMIPLSTRSTSSGATSPDGCRPGHSSTM